MNVTSGDFVRVVHDKMITTYLLMKKAVIFGPILSNHSKIEPLWIQSLIGKKQDGVYTCNHLNSGLFKYKTEIDHLNTGQVQYSVDYCILFF